MTDSETPPSLTAQALVVNWRAEADRTRPSYINGRRCDLRVNSERAVATFRKCADDLAALIVQVERLETLLKRIYEWDHMDSAADGPYWRREIKAALRGSDR